MKVSIMIQARTNSTRFPGKIYEKIGTKSLLEWCWGAAYAAHRALNALKIDSVPMVIGPQTDDTLKEFCQKEGMRALFPSCAEDDLVKRYRRAAFQEQASHLIRLTSDCWQIPSDLIVEVVHLLITRDYVSNTIRRTFPEGFDIQGCSFRALEWFDQHQVRDREHLFKTFDHNEDTRVQFEKEGFTYTELLNPRLSFLIKGSSIDTKDDLEAAREWWNAQNQKDHERVSRKSQNGTGAGVSGNELEATHAVS